MILGKLAPPRAPDGHVERARLVERLDRGGRVVTVVAPPGYGKTEAVRQWAASRDTAWLTVDLLDDDPDDFWTDLLSALRVVLPDIDADLDRQLRARGSSDPHFVAALISEIERLDTPTTLVLDGVERGTDRTILERLALVVDRVGHLLRLVVVGRSDLLLPTARWRSAGWLSDVREADLRFTDGEALALAATFAGLHVPDASVLALNQRAEGWAAGLHLSLLAIVDSDDAEADAHRASGSDRLLADYLVAEVLDGLPSAEREVALGLSVLDVFDADLCAALLGPATVPVARDLGRRRLFISVIDDATGAMRFHPMFRELLEHELRWRDPEARVVLHRRAAGLWRERGDPSAAARHLSKAGDVALVMSTLPASPTRPVPEVGTPTRGPAAGALIGIESLTPREQSLLELLPTHLSYAQMGEHLYLSVNTVKSNLKVLYRKLGATNRATAVAEASTCGLLSRRPMPVS